MNRILILIVFCTHFMPAVGDEKNAEQSEVLRYFGQSKVAKTRLEIQSLRDGGKIYTSTNGSGNSKLTVHSTFDSGQRLVKARVTSETKQGRLEATAKNNDGKVTVARDDGRTSTFEIPQRVIVTSAPDWTDAILLTRWYDLEMGGQQKFAGLWIHPTKDPLRLTLKIEKVGVDVVKLEGEKTRFVRCLITLRNGSRYIGWRNEQKQLVKLIPQGKTNGIVLEGWWEVAAKLVAGK